VEGLRPLSAGQPIVVREVGRMCGMMVSFHAAVFYLNDAPSALSRGNLKRDITIPGVGVTVAVLD